MKSHAWLPEVMLFKKLIRKFCVNEKSIDKLIINLRISNFQDLKAVQNNQPPCLQSEYEAEIQVNLRQL